MPQRELLTRFTEQTHTRCIGADSHKVVVWNASGVTDGRFFQITPEGDIVWEYVPPYAAGRRLTVASKPSKAAAFLTSFPGA